MKKYFIKKAILCTIYILCALLIEMLTFINLGLGIFPEYFFMTFAFILAIAIILFMIPGYWLPFGLAVFMLLVQSILGIVNINLYLILDDIFSMDMLQSAGGGEEADFIEWIMFDKILIFVGPMAAFLLLTIVIGIVLKYERVPFKSNMAITLASIFIASSAIIPALYSIQVNNLRVDTTSSDLLRVNDKALYKNMNVKTSFFRKFGTFPTYFRNIICGHEFGSTKIASTQEYQDYFKDVTYFDETPYFNIAEDNNLLLIQLESFSEFFLSEKYTPTLWNLKEQSIDFTNNYSKGYTEITRSSVILGSLPDGKLVGERIQTWNKGNDFFDFSLPNQLLNNGFDTAEYFAAEAASFRNNNKSFERYGFQEINRLAYNASESTYDYSNYRPAEKYFNSKWTPSYYNEKWRYPEEWYYEMAYQDILPQDKGRFFSFVNTVNPHGPYKDNSMSPYHSELKKTIDSKDFTWINKKVYPTFENALSMAIGVDKGIALLMQKLNELGLQDNTTIMFYADHNAYFGDLSRRVLDVKKNNPATYKVPAFIVTPEISEHIKVTKFTTYYDYPVTLFQLFGIKVNSKLYFGYDALDDNYESIHKCRAGGIYNNKFFTFDGIDKYWESETATSEDWREFQTEVKRFQDIMPYFNKLYTKNRPKIACN